MAGGLRLCGGRGIGLVLAGHSRLACAMAPRKVTVDDRHRRGIDGAADIYGERASWRESAAAGTGRRLGCLARDPGEPMACGGVGYRANQAGDIWVRWPA